MSTQDRTNEQYLAYLNTDMWRNLAEKRLELDKHRCQCCGSGGTPLNPLNVHHFNYKMVLGTENPCADLVTLCRSCHIGIHKVMNRVTNEQGRRGWRDIPYVPNVHTYSLNGATLERTKEMI